MTDSVRDFAVPPIYYPNLEEEIDHQNQQNQVKMKPDDLLDEFLDDRIYDQNRDFIKDESGSGQNINFNFVDEITNDHNNDGFNSSKTQLAGASDIIHSILSRNYLEESNQMPDQQQDADEYIFKINSSNDSNNSIIPPATPPNNEQVYKGLEDMDINYGFNEFYDNLKVTDIQSEEFRLYEESRKELMKLSFGPPVNSNTSTLLNTTIPPQMKMETDDADVNSFQLPDEYYDTTNDDKLPYKMKITGLPDHSRVETQIKINLSISPAPPQFLLRLPPDTISKTKLRLQDELPLESQKHILYLDTYVMTSGEIGSRKKKSASNNNNNAVNSPASEGTSPNTDSSTDFKLNRSMKSCNICSRCVRRELKRASRRKNSSLEDGFNWKLVGPKRAVIFNCKEVISFPPPMVTQADRDEIYDYIGEGGKDSNEAAGAAQLLLDEKKIEISSRIICYCRHHSEPKGFRLFFVLKNHEGEILAKSFSSPIMIMDRKKMPGPEKSELGNVNDSSKPLSPTSLEESSSELTTADSRPTKRKRTWSPSANVPASTYCDSVSQQRSVSLLSKKELLSPGDSSSERSPKIFGNNSMTTPERSASITSATSNISSVVNSGKSHQASVNVPALPSNKPSIQRIIPAQGPIRGGIEVTLLGSNFRPGLTVRFGANQALTTHCWSDSTIVTYLPPASTAGQVLVTFDYNNNSNHADAAKQAPPQQVFTYTDDTDRQLIELALQIVGLKMNGKLEDAKHIAKRIIGNSSDNSNAVSPAGNGSTNGNTNTASNQMQLSSTNEDWLSKATETVKELSQNSSDSEEILLKFLSLLDLPNAPILTPNWAICTLEGQTLLHLAAMKNYYNLVLFLIKRGSRVDYKDVNDFTPLHFLFINGHREIIEMLIKVGANLNNKIRNNVTLEKISNSNVLDLIPQELVGTTVGSVISHTRRSSNDSIGSMFNDIDGSLRQHISRMVDTSELDNANTGNDLDDDEFADESDASSYKDDSSDDEEEDEISVAAGSSDVNVHESQMQEASSTPSPAADLLPKYDDLFPSGSSLKSLIKSITHPHSKSLESFDGVSTSVESSGSNVEEVVTVEENDSEEIGTEEGPYDDKLFKFFSNSSARTTPIRRDLMLFFFWLPLLLITLALVLGFNNKLAFEEQFSNCNEMLRMSLLNFMLGRERVEGMINSVNAAVTAGFNNMNI